MQLIVADPLDVKTLADPEVSGSSSTQELSGYVQPAVDAGQEAQVTYGQKPESDWDYKGTHQGERGDNFGSSFLLFSCEEYLKSMELSHTLFHKVAKPGLAWQPKWETKGSSNEDME
ncbi:UNVERIFIED_CONTAM: hypothetical protein K2H54_031061 [Gekko kuhli]